VQTIHVFIKRRRFYEISGVLAGLITIGTAWLAYSGWGTSITPGKPWPKIKIAQALVLIAWTVLPPIYFWFEYWFVYLGDHRPGHKTPDDLELFKYGQELSARMWLAATSCVLILYFGKDLRP
jgi:hypothetical protein